MAYGYTTQMILDVACQHCDYATAFKIYEEVRERLDGSECHWISTGSKTFEVVDHVPHRKQDDDSD